MLYLTLVNVQPEEWCSRLETGLNVIGRATTASVRLPNRFQRVSRQHATIEVTEWETSIWDMGSSCGTTINGVHLEPKKKVSLSVRDRIRLADAELNLWNSDPHPLAPTESIAPTDADENGDTYVFGEGIAIDAMNDPLFSDLTPAELEVLLWMSRGYTRDVELGKVLFRSPNTVRTQVSSIFSKLGVHSRTELVTLLSRSG